MYNNEHDDKREHELKKQDDDLEYNMKKSEDREIHESMETIENAGDAENVELENEQLDDLTQPRRLHPAAMFFSLVQLIKDTILGFGIGLIVTFQNSFVYFIIFASLFLGFMIISSVLSWIRFTYRVEDNELRIEQGIFVRRKRYISINRIHKIDLTANVVHRIFKLVNVQIDTASSGGGAEVDLSAVKLAEGERLRQALKKSVKQASVETEEVEEISYPQQKISWKRLFIAGTTSGGVGIILAAVLAGFSQIEQLIPQEMYDATFTWIVGLGIMLIVMFVLATLVIIWIFGIAGTMIKYGNFTIEKREKELFIKRGLLETKELTIPFDRIQAIGVQQTLIRQPIKFVQVFAVVAGGSFDKMEPFPVLFPIMREREVASFIDKFVPDYKISNDKFTPLAKRGLKFYLMTAAIIPVLLLIPVAYFFPTLSWIPIILILISLWFGWLKHRDGGYYVEGKRLVLRKRRVNKVMITTYHHRIQSLEKNQHLIQRKQNIANISLSLIGLGGLGTHYTLRHVEDEDANKIADWYSYRKDHDVLDNETGTKY